MCVYFLVLILNIHKLLIVALILALRLLRNSHNTYSISDRYTRIIRSISEHSVSRVGKNCTFIDSPGYKIRPAHEVTNFYQ